MQPGTPDLIDETQGRRVSSQRCVTRNALQYCTSVHLVSVFPLSRGLGSAMCEPCHPPPPHVPVKLGLTPGRRLHALNILYMTRLRLMFFGRGSQSPLQPLEVVLHGLQFMPVAGLAWLIAAYLTSRRYIVREQIASAVSC
jgi:hypothetical protein